MKIKSLKAFSASLFMTTLISLGFGTPGFTETSHAESSNGTKPTIVLVHGAFAESSSWNGVVTRLLAQGYPVVAVANPLRGLRSDSEYVATVLRSIHGPVVAVGHSYGGSVITDAAVGIPNVKALVYVAGLAPELGESAADISDHFPGSTLGPTLAAPVLLPDGGKDLYIEQDKFYGQFAADVPGADALLMAATQRPVTESALHELQARLHGRQFLRGSFLDRWIKTSWNPLIYSWPGGRTRKKQLMLKARHMS